VVKKRALGDDEVNPANLLIRDSGASDQTKATALYGHFRKVRCDAQDSECVFLSSVRCQFPEYLMCGLWHCAQIFESMAIAADTVPSRDGIDAHVRQLAQSSATETTNNLAHFCKRLSAGLRYIYPEKEELYDLVVDPKKYELNVSFVLYVFVSADGDPLELAQDRSRRRRSSRTRRELP